MSGGISACISFSTMMGFSNTIGVAAVHDMSMDKQARNAILIGAICFALASVIFSLWLLVIMGRLRSLETKTRNCHPQQALYGTAHATADFLPEPR